ncbi:MAG: VOC family protein [Alphaproteobacteria bacterium]|nr:VOC family protein [Alphaproteobacteria bacterium]
MKAPRRVLETALYADDLDAAEGFYGGILHLEKITRVGDRHVFYRCGEGVLLIFNAKETTRPSSNPALPVPPHGSHGPGHMCFGASAAELDAISGTMIDAGVTIEADFHWPGGARSIYVRDPAGNSIEFAEPGLWGFDDPTKDLR